MYLKYMIIRFSMEKKKSSLKTAKENKISTSLSL